MRRPFRRVARRLTGRRVSAPTAPPPPDHAATEVPPHRESLLRALERGADLERAVVGQVRSLIGAGEGHSARSLAESLRRREPTQALGHLAAGIEAHLRGYDELAHAEFRHVPRRMWASLAAAEYVRAGLAVAPAETLREISELVAEDPTEVGPRNWFQMLGPVYGVGASDTARALFEVFDRRLGERPGSFPDGAAHRDWMRDWVAADPTSPSAPPPDGGRTTFAVMDYGHPGANRASANIGDHIQSIAALGHLVRHRGVRLHGPDELVSLLERLGQRVRPGLERRDVEADLEVLTVHRDASMYEAIPESTWVLCFGWYMHALFGVRHGFPLHRNLRPIFVSFHCNKREMLTEEAVDYLRRYGPVGCRDWTTVYLLLSLDVPAFFSGCLTTTISTVFPERGGPADGKRPIAYVDADPADVPEDGVSYRHSEGAVRRRSFVANVDRALELLETYRTRHSAVVTSRLHCYLPVRSLGLPVDFRPSNPSDVRFDGLSGIDDASFDAIRDGLLARLEPVFTAILGGRSEEEVYGLWREINAGDVAAAERRRAEPLRLPPVTDLISGQIAAAVAAVETDEPSSGQRDGEPVHVAVLLPNGGGRALGALVASLLEESSRSLHVHVLVAPGAGGIRRRLVERIPEAAYSWIPLEGIGEGLVTPAGAAPPAGRLVRLLLGDLLPGVDRLVLLPLPSVATADIAGLAGLDLGAHALAAPTRTDRRAISGFNVIHAAAARLREATDAAAALRRTAHARHRFDFDAFTGDVLVLDLQRLRRERLSAEALPLVAAFGLDDVEALHYVFGAARTVIPEAWATVPTRTPARHPGLLHWADPVKPWKPELTPERERWRRHAARLRDGGAIQAAR